MNKAFSSKVIVISAPSGSGKTTIVKSMASQYPILSFSISATTRPPRKGEKNGIDYYFISEEEFKQKMENNKLLEYEMVYTGIYYGTLVSELNRIWRDSKIPLLEIDVNGSIQVENNTLGFDVLSIFIEPPSMEVLKQRLIQRGTESQENLDQRLKKASFEMLFKDKFDYVVRNDDLDECISQVSKIIHNFL